MNSGECFINNLFHRFLNHFSYKTAVFCFVHWMVNYILLFMVNNKFKGNFNIKELVMIKGNTIVYY